LVVFNINILRLQNSIYLSHVKKNNEKVKLIQQRK